MEKSKEFRIEFLRKRVEFLARNDNMDPNQKLGLYDVDWVRSYNE